MWFDPRRARVGRGALALELLLLLPLLVALIAGMVEFSRILSAKTQLGAAATAGARVAALGGDGAAAEQAARNVLGSGSLSQADVTVIWTDANGNPLPPGAQVEVV